MKKFLLRALFFLLPFLYSIYVSAQPGKERDCSTTCFSTEVVSMEKISATCTAYELRVSYSGKCAHALSHFTVQVPCGKIGDLWNSQNWKQVYGTDPTTGLTGFKIDDISGFGETAEQHFTVKFTLCAEGESCAGQLTCWQPIVAYKASTCVNYDTLSVRCQQLKASLKKQDASCFGAADGSLSVVTEAGQEPFTFSWSDGSVDSAITGLSAGLYVVVVRDASGAELTLQDTIRQSGQIVLNGQATPASCNGLANGTIDLTVSGGVPPYSFLWNNGATTEDPDGLASGSYSVNVTDAKGCTAEGRFTVGNKANIRITSSLLKPDCNDNNGTIDITVSGGRSPYTFQWSDGSTGEDLTGIPAGLYTVTVTDSAGCFEKAAFLLRENNTLAITGTPLPTSCSDDASGLIDISVLGGTAPYSFTWSNGATTEDLSGLTSGYYTVTVTDAKGCTANAGFTVAKKTFQLSRTVHSPSCNGGADGTVTLDPPDGGTEPYTYQWSNGATGPSLSDVSAGVYTVVVTDATGCSRTLTITVTDPQPLAVTSSVSNSNCNAEGFFSIDLTVSGGTAPYTFSWSDGSTIEDIDSLHSGTYSVVITDANGCNTVKEIVVEAPPAPWACLISEPAAMPVCGSVSNQLSTTVTDAESYSWTIASSDGNWSITSPADSAAISFTAGGQNSSATFTLTIQKDGCLKTCTYTITACTTQDNNGGGTDPGEGGPGETPGSGDGGDQTCGDCFNTTATLINEEGSCRTYEMEVSTTGLCRHELSHWTLAIPCGSIRDYSNSEGWKMVFGQDPTTGLYGLKVDDINAFGKEVASFTVRFTLCESVNCDLSSWTPTVAYKAGLCVSKETINLTGAPALTVSVYPNPFEEAINFEWSLSGEHAVLQIIDQYGNTVCHTSSVSENGNKYSIGFNTPSLPRGIYYYRLTVDGKTFTGKVSKR
ncbi:MAG TPA: T9SS type A sorting domain-containing protein [Chryseosolibacter sp.]